MTTSGSLARMQHDDIPGSPARMQHDDIGRVKRGPAAPHCHELSHLSSHAPRPAALEHLEHLECRLQPIPPGCFTEKLGWTRGNGIATGVCVSV